MKFFSLKCQNIAMVFLYLALLRNRKCYSSCIHDLWEKVPCDADVTPNNCDFEKLSPLTVEDFDRCAPAKLKEGARNYFLGAAGRRITYNENKAAYKRIRIIPKLLRDVSKSSMATSTLGQAVSFPIALSPVAEQKLAHPMGEVETIRAVSKMGTIMILYSYSNTRLEEVAANNKGGSSHLWMQTYIFANKTFTENIVKRAERAGFEAIVVTVDSPVLGTLTCGGRDNLEFPEGTELINLPGQNDADNLVDMSETFKDISWLTRLTYLPIVAKGILSAPDALEAVRAGASAIFVSNHGGRQLDSVPATIDVLPGIVDAVHQFNPGIDVYVDGGVRNGYDIYKAIASGAKLVFFGRPIVWGLAENGENGVKDVVNILRREFNETMLLAGASSPSEITRDTLIKI